MAVVFQFVYQINTLHSTGFMYFAAQLGNPGQLLVSISLILIKLNSGTRYIKLI
jgi:hypothetical protein